ncbi:peptidase family protein (putative zinc metallopeptidase) [Desulforapulum autotrophicum HRM2]|uniref:Peptidase family protein (Putative zinc metallopeptidase) n=1 Tax=Desulforapulum autotrophicum (strain ATCC 43914 / DSM 3382 / VKM B-1955 / HRM2) TaxID=177437 RepID=C0QM21_DESAH|nr:M20/M25/M40 family metallo-hydrolase [Desulforapulum autotrophicum]ACN14327.1 peptidase family protein (putative zinc metallopeptidase) [Desulforapulum autotrophicum HRM2]
MNRYKDEIIPLLKELIEFKSTASRPIEISRCADFIETYVKQTGARYTRIDHNNIPSILVTPKGKVTPVLLMAHFDVVEAEDPLFTAVENQGNLYGRGSNDDKYAVAVCLVLLKKWMATLEKNQQSQAHLPFGILITGDEETGGYDGAQYALRQVKANFAIALDGGNPEKVILKEKGMLQLELAAHGKAAHGARPWLGVNAIDLLVDDLQKIRPLFMDKAEGHWHKTLNLGIIRGGDSVNQVCDKAWALLDIRYTENDDPDQIVADIDGLTHSTITIKEKEPLFTGGHSDYLDKLLSLVPQAVTGNEHGASDARFLGDLNIPGIIWGARGNQTAHAKDEHVEIKSVIMVFETLDRFMDLIEKENSPNRR